MYFTNGSSRAFEMLMRGKPGFDRYENGGCADCEDCNTCHFYRPHWKVCLLPKLQPSLKSWIAP